MSALELFKALGDESNRPPSPPKHILKKKKTSQAGRVKRYWPGKAPDFAEDEDSYSDDSGPEEPQVKPAAEPDRRLSRYQATKGTNLHSHPAGDAEDVSDRIRRRRAQVETITVYQSDPPRGAEARGGERPPAGPGSADGPARPAEGPPTKLDRNTLRQLALEFRRQEEAALATKPQEDEDEEPESSDEPEYSEDERAEETTEALSKPLFVPKCSRTTEAEKEQLQRQEQMRRENERRRLQERKRDTKELVVKKLQEGEQEPEEDEELIDDTDNLDEKEFELWKIRELKRILRDKEEREKARKLVSPRNAQEEELALRRSMTDEERERDNQNVDKVVVEKGKLRFLQKYYHKGAFFMDKLYDKSEPLYARDFNAPTADDLVDKTLLPKPMRVRRGQYGKQGRVKHTHLKDVDTTQFDAWAPADKLKLAGTKQVFDRPSRKKGPN